MSYPIRILSLASVLGLCACAGPGFQQPYAGTAVCGNTAVGTLGGAAAGALIGNAVAGRHNKGAGTAIGAVGGALLGGAAGQTSCEQPVYAPPPAVVYAPPPPPVVYGPPPGYYAPPPVIVRQGPPPGYYGYYR